MHSNCSVLIVDPLEETREVLKTALARRGMTTLCAAKASSGLDLARRHHPDLIVLDVELDGPADPADSEDLAGAFAEQAKRDDASLVMLGTVRRQSRPASGEFVAKPYHYGPLIRRIEEMLGSASPGEVRRG